MKKINILFLAILLLAVVNKTTAQNCCKKPTGNSMQALAMNESFRSAHLAPLPLNYTPEKGKMITFPVIGGADGNAFYIPADVPTNKVLIVFHEWWGLNDYIKREAENWHKDLEGKVNVYAVDLYDGKVAADPETAGKLMGGLDQKRGAAIISGLISKIGKDKKIATLGWCMGGSWSFAGTVLAGKQAAGCVMYYGFPEKDITKIRPLKCDILYIRGTKDDYIKEADVKTFEEKVKGTGHKITTYSYDAVHAFANPSNPKYDEKSAGEAHQVAFIFLREKLNGN